MMKMTVRNNRAKISLILICFCIVLVSSGALFYFLVLAKPSPPNVVFILIDTLRSDHLSCAGYERKTSPCIDEIASEGVFFNKAISQSSWTLPSMISLMSGKYIFTKIPKLPDDTMSLAQMMKKGGYSTAGFIANSLVGKNEGFSKGFDHFEVRQKSTAQWTGADLNNRLLPYMKKSLKPPFFLYVHYLDPHYPYSPPEDFIKFDEEFDPVRIEYRKRYSEFCLEHEEVIPTAKKDVDLIKKNITLYDGEVKYVDRCVGEVMLQLKRMGLEENTVVVITSDHGEGLWNHLHHKKVVEKHVPMEKRNLTTYFLRDHGYHLYQELIHVPLIIKGPNIRKNETVSVMVENVDIIPTLLSLTDIDIPFNGDGRSLAQFLTNPDFTLDEKRLIFSHCDEGTCTIQPVYNSKLVVPNKTGKYFGMKTSLYDLSADPGEMKNMASEYKDVYEALHKAIDNKEQSDYFKNKTGELDDATRIKMKELGYIDKGKRK